MEDQTTKPTIETVLERMGAMEDRISHRFSSVDVRLDRIESLAHSTRGEMLELRADFKELRTQLIEHFPVLH